MRLLILPYAAAVALAQLATPPGVPVDIPRLVAMAGVLGSLAVLIYRLGVWRKEMETRLDALDHLMVEAKEFRHQTLRRHRRTAKRLEQLEDKSQ